MICPLCRQRKARRACPALGQHICTVCCGTKRLVEIACPDDCPYLAAARDHPPARVVRKQEDDLASIARFMRDLNDRQAELFFLVLTFVARYPSTASRFGELAHEGLVALDLASLVDEDVAQAAAALAATYETASRGLVYEHRAQSLPAGRLANELKALLAKAGSGLGSVFDREAALVLRRVQAAATRPTETQTPGNPRAFLDLIGRVIRLQSESDRPSEAPPEPSRLIVP